MTAPAPHRPSPADLVHPRPHTPPATTAPAQAPAQALEVQTRAPRPLTPEEAIAPGTLHAGEQFRVMYQRGLLISGMTPHARLLGHTLLWHANHATGRISPNLQPSNRQLAESTGLSTGQIDVQLQVLLQRGWLQLHRIQEGPRTGRHRLELTIPTLYLARVRAGRAPRPAQTARTDGGTQ